MHSWQKRALDPDSPTTKDNETVRTTSSEYRGKEILYPTIRMIDGKLKKLSDKEAKQYALVKNDYIEFVSPNQAEAWSKSFSNLINDTREDMNQRQAGNVLRRNAPRGEFPAFINQQTVTTGTATSVVAGAADTLSDNIQNNIISEQTEKE